MSQKVVLHIGCGPDHIINTHGFEAENWREVRLDIDASFNPDIVSNMLDMKEVENGSVDAVFSSHNIEHLFAHEVPLACKEFLRVLRPEGYLILTVLICSLCVLQWRKINLMIRCTTLLRGSLSRQLISSLDTVHILLPACIIWLINADLQLKL